MLKNKIFYNFNIDDSFSARPKELLRIYDENILDSELSGIIDRLKLFRQKIQMIKTPVKNESIVENKEVFHFESSKQPSTILANYFLDIEVNFLAIFLRDGIKMLYCIRLFLRKVVCMLHIWQPGIIL